MCPSRSVCAPGAAVTCCRVVTIKRCRSTRCGWIAFFALLAHFSACLGLFPFPCDVCLSPCRPRSVCPRSPSSRPCPAAHPCAARGALPSPGGCVCVPALLRPRVCGRRCSVSFSSSHACARPRFFVGPRGAARAERFCPAAERAGCGAAMGRQQSSGNGAAPRGCPVCAVLFILFSFSVFFFPFICPISFFPFSFISSVFPPFLFNT